MSGVFDAGVVEEADHELSPLAERRARRRRVLRRRRIVAGCVAALLVVGLSTTVLSIWPLGGHGAPVVLTVTEGESTDQVIAAMSSAGIIHLSPLFRVDLSVTGTPTIVPGHYEMPTNLSYGEAKALLAAGPNVSEVEVGNAQMLSEVVNDVANYVSTSYGQKFAQALASHAVRSPFQPTATTSLEGLLGVGTYLVAPSTTPTQLLGAMVRRYVDAARHLGFTPSTTVEGHDAYEVATIASITEKEGYYPSNMGKVARVIYNRLATGTPLQMDSTVLYAYDQDGGQVTRTMLENPTPYNTYLHTGLTPTPVCQPSNAALEAALHPTPGPWRYFTLLDRKGDTAFATTFAQQLANEAIGERNGIR